MASPYRYPRPEDFEPGADERAAAQTSAKAQGEAAGWGGLIGTGVGTLAGLAPLLLGQPELLPVTVGAGATLGNQIGGAIGGEVGGDEADKADALLQERAAGRQKKLSALELRQRALDKIASTA